MIDRQTSSIDSALDVRDLLRSTTEERNLAAAVGAVDAVVEDYCRRAESALDGRDVVDRSWAAVREAKRHGVPDVVLQRGVWRAHTQLLDRLVSAAVRQPAWSSRPQAGWHAEQLTSFTVRYWEAAAQVYAATEPAGVLVHLLAGDGLDVAETQRTLGLRLEEAHWALVLWSESSDAQVEDLIRFALTVARAVGGARPLIVVSRSSEVWMWTRWPKPPVPQALGAACALLAMPAGIGVSAGPVRAGAAGFRGSLLAARAGRQEVGARAGRRWHNFEGVSATSLLATDDEQSRWFVVEVLGELGFDDPRCVTLRETLRLYLARGRSRQQVAAELFINRNTVAYRVQQALKLLGRSIDEDAFDVRLALEIARASATTGTVR